MVAITFPDREREKRALAFLIGRFSGRMLKSGVYLVPEEALKALTDQGIPFTVESLDAVELNPIDHLWIAEAKRRRDEVRSGQVEAVLGEEALRKIRESLG